MSKCSDNAGWQPAGDHIQTSFGPSDRNTFLVLGLHVDGFRGEPSITDGKVTGVGQVRFTFEVNCSLDCELVFLSVSLLLSVCLTVARSVCLSVCLSSSPFEVSCSPV